MAQRRERGTSRREFVAGVGAAGAAFAIGRARAREVTKISFVSFGGSYGDFAREYWIKPFTAETGIVVDYVNGPDLAKVKAQVSNRNVEWDVFDGPGSAGYAGVEENLWEPIDARLIDSARFTSKLRSELLVPTFIYTGGIAYDPARTKRPARNFRQLWDVRNFPGRRGLRTRVSETMEIALLADGVEPAKLYPLDLDRGFKVLERIRNSVKKWFEQTTQGITLIQTNEVDYTYTYANRVKAAKDAGVSLEFSFDQCLSATNYFMVPRGSPRKEAAMRFIEYVTRPEQQAVMAEKLGLFPVTRGALDRVSAAARAWLPDIETSTVRLDDEYWRDHFVAADKRFKEWILG